MENINSDPQTIMACPLPKENDETITLAHGGGGEVSHRLIEEVFRKNFTNEFLDMQHDGAMIDFENARLAFTTDSFVVKPLFFPGGNIGMLSVCGTVNDLAMCGAKPLYLSAGFIIEEGFEFSKLRKIVESMNLCAGSAGVMIVTGDTKVVEKGKGDGLFINTSGIGLIKEGVDICPRNCMPGDSIILSGKIGEHGIAIMAERYGFDLEKTVLSDVAPLNELVQSILESTRDVHMMRDPTRGGLAACLNEIAVCAGCGIMIDEVMIPVSEEVLGACEIMGFDPLYIANEGKMVIIVPPAATNRVMRAMRGHPLGRDAAIIGMVTDDHSSAVSMKTKTGSLRIVDMLSGEQLPRIC